jgi:prepilin-type N-terminal cleavage/methylation domain-containing protein/prepilin-type processing-associated H-X9-DG protein
MPWTNRRPPSLDVSPRSRGFTIVELLIVIAIIGVLVALLLPAIQAAREAARRTSCVNNLRQIGVALTTYHDTFLTLPAAVSDSWGGSPQLHSWAVFILPYVEESRLYALYSFPAGQNAAVNRPVVSTPLSIYSCPSSDNAYYEGDGHYAKGDYAASSGIEPVANGGAMYPASRIPFRKITDGLSKTFLVGEVYYHNLGWARGSAAGTTGGGGGGGAAFSRGVSRWWSCNSPCAQPGINPATTDCNNHCEQRFQFSSPHNEGVTFLFGDGHVDFLRDSIDLACLQALTTIAGGEVPQSAPD